MARPTYKVRLIVLRKTKLGEKDVIVTFLAEDGSLGKAVAKGARKPGGSYAARLELFSVADCLIVEGRGLGIVSDAKLVGSFSFAGAGIEQTACASVVAELMCSIAQEGLAHPRLFDMTRAALEAIATHGPCEALAVAMADVLKTLAVSGFRPVLGECAMCGEPIGLSARQGRVAVSVQDGGTVCRDHAYGGLTYYAPETLQWIQALTLSTFGDILDATPDEGTLLAIIPFVRQWTETHIGRSPKSLEFLTTCFARR